MSSNTSWRYHVFLITHGLGESCSHARILNVGNFHFAELAVMWFILFLHTVFFNWNELFKAKCKKCTTYRFHPAWSPCAAGSPWSILCITSKWRRKVHDERCALVTCGIRRLNFISSPSTTFFHLILFIFFPLFPFFQRVNTATAILIAFKLLSHRHNVFRGFDGLFLLFHFSFMVLFFLHFYTALSIGFALMCDAVTYTAPRWQKRKGCVLTNPVN